MYNKMNMTKPLVIFSHGKESGPQGSKIQALAAVAQAHGAQVISVDYRQAQQGEGSGSDLRGEADRRVAQLLATPLPPHDRLILVGSSMGGYVATVASGALKPAGLFLLAPAFYKDGYAEQNPLPHASYTTLVHGWRDDVVPPENSIRFAQQHRCALHMLDGDHRLNDALAAITPLFSNFLETVLGDADQAGTRTVKSAET